MKIEKSDTGCGRRLQRIFFKTLRVFYVSWLYYFMPYSIFFVPYLAEMSRI